MLEVEGGLALLPLLGGGDPWELEGGLEELVGEAGGGDAVLGGGEVLLGVRVVVMGPAVVARVASWANCCVPAKLPEGPWLRVSVTDWPAHERGSAG